MAPHLILEVVSSSLILTLNNPTKGNAMSRDMQVDLIAALKSASADDKVIAVVLRANGKHYCTGMDMSKSGSAVHGSSQTLESSRLQLDRFNNGLKVFKAINDCPKPTIALITGDCYGGGNGLAFACDIRIALESVRFVLPEVRRGVSPALISRYIVREWGVPMAREAMVTGRPVGAGELRASGAVHHLVKDAAAASETLNKILKGLKMCAPRAIGQSKLLVNAVYEENLNESQVIIRDVFMDMTRPSDEARHGISQFQQGNKNVDWADWYASKKPSKI